jgi:hypothetical protein
MISPTTTLLAMILLIPYPFYSSVAKIRFQPSLEPNFLPRSFNQAHKSTGASAQDGLHVQTSDPAGLALAMAVRRHLRLANVSSDEVNFSSCSRSDHIPQAPGTAFLQHSLQVYIASTMAFDVVTATTAPTRASMTRGRGGTRRTAQIPRRAFLAGTYDGRLFQARNRISQASSNTERQVKGDQMDVSVDYSIWNILGNHKQA